MDYAYIKQETTDVPPGFSPLPPQESHRAIYHCGENHNTNRIIPLRSDSDIERRQDSGKRKRVIELDVPPGFSPLHPTERLALQETTTFQHYKNVGSGPSGVRVQMCKQFWKAGDYEVTNTESSHNDGDIDLIKVHPNFLHSNATSHKWALGAVAELVDNAMDEEPHGATCVYVDVLENANQCKMLLVQDNGRGMTPNKMRGCMSLGYSAKSKMANTIGQYGNGFKSSTMRLGADVIVFSRSQGGDEQSSTRSIGMLSYTFLMETGKDNIIVPMIHFEKLGDSWRVQGTPNFQKNLETIKQWSPYKSEQDLIQQFNNINDHGTRIIIYNLWEDDQGALELDFEADQHDIQIKGENRDKKKKMAQIYPNSQHFFTYGYSLRTYLAILYRRIPHGFRIILRGKEVQHHDVLDDMMEPENHICTRNGRLPKSNTADENGVTVTVGFVKDAIHHIDVQGFNIYHKNRLIKPFLKEWNSSSSRGRGVIGVLEVDFIAPAHDKQGFEQTAVFTNLKETLRKLQGSYWSLHRNLIEYSISPEPGTTKSVSEKRVVSASGSGSTACKSSTDRLMEENTELKSRLSATELDRKWLTCKVQFLELQLNKVHEEKQALLTSFEIERSIREAEKAKLYTLSKDAGQSIGNLLKEFESRRM